MGEAVETSRLTSILKQYFQTFTFVQKTVIRARFYSGTREQFIVSDVTVLGVLAILCD